MIARILAWVGTLVGGGNLMAWALGACLLAAGTLGALWRVEAAQRDAADLRITAVTQQLTTANAALADRAQVIGALERQADATLALQAELEPTRRAIYAAPRTTACVASPVVRAGIDSLRAARARAAAAATRPGAGTGPADVPATSGGAGDGTGR